MSDLREKRAAEIQDAIRQVLYREWDPIGVCGAEPDDEYGLVYCWCLPNLGDVPI